MEKSCTGKNIYENLLNSHILFYENIRWLLIYFLKVYSILCVHVLFLILGSLHWTPNTGKLLSTLRNNHREVMQQCWIYSNCRFREEGGNCITTHKRSMSQSVFRNISVLLLTWDQYEPVNVLIQVIQDFTVHWSKVRRGHKVLLGPLQLAVQSCYSVLQQAANRSKWKYKNRNTSSAALKKN